MEDELHSSVEYCGTGLAAGIWVLITAGTAVASHGDIIAAQVCH